MNPLASQPEPNVCCYWVFDLDGTLTVPAHDFEGIRRELRLPTERPILEEIAQLPEAIAVQAMEQLDQIEYEVARKAVPQPGAGHVVRELRSRNCKVGVFSRNSARSVGETLKQCGLEKLFQVDHIMARESCEPKPDPKGIHMLLSRWQGRVRQAVMVGDYLYDMQAGREAGVVTVGFNGDGHFRWKDYADYCVTDLTAILTLPIVPPKRAGT
jgi:HAD superfamily hydrolase (TIGR01509 family)